MTETERILDQSISRLSAIKQAELAVLSTENAYIAAQKRANTLFADHADVTAYMTAENEAQRLFRAAMDATERLLAMKGIDASLQEVKP